jgi:tRNA threonylcarbamoyladenosine biosynthesis protein TsaB
LKFFLQNAYMTPKTLILAVETSGRLGSVAVAAGEQILAETSFSGPMRHSSELFPALSALLARFHRKPKDIEHIYISVGPGSFTGLRIAVALAKTMHLANAAKVVAVDTLDVIAANAADYLREEKTNIGKFATILDAKRGQFYVAVYKRLSRSTDTQYEKIQPDCLMTASQFLERFAHNAEPIWLLGEGLVYHTDAFKAENIHFFEKKYWNPRAAKVHSLGRQLALEGNFADPLTLQPNYLLRPEAEEKHKSST